MSVFYAQIKHKLIEFHSKEFKSVIQLDSSIKECADFIHNLVADSQFVFLGYVDLSVKIYFLIGSVGRGGEFKEFPMSTDTIKLLKECKDELLIHRLKKALCKGDLGKFIIEYSKFADSALDEMIVSF